MPRIALGLSYNGSAFEGWQSQLSGNTIQDVLESCLRQFTQESTLRTHCAGRTDAGVHALMQVVHFDTQAVRPLHSWVRACNGLLPSSISIHWAQEVSSAFHARQQALSRRYSYLLKVSHSRPSLDAARVGWLLPLNGRDLNQDNMVTAAQMLIGEHDFSAFRASDCQALSPIKTLQHIGIAQKGVYWRFDFEGTAFLHHMVRNIMGCLLYIGMGKQEPSWMQEVLMSKSRRMAAPTFSPDGLYFLGPRYDPSWGLPDETDAFSCLPVPGKW